MAGFSPMTQQMQNQNAAVLSDEWGQQVAAMKADEEARIAALERGKIATVAIDECVAKVIADTLQTAHDEAADLLLKARTEEQIESVYQRIATIVAALRWCDELEADLQ